MAEQNVSVLEALNIAAGHHRAGNLEEANEIYRSILTVEPHQPDALHLLGVLAGQTGRAKEGIYFIQQAVTARPDFAAAWSNLGRLYADDGCLAESVKCYKQVTILTPNVAQSWFALGIALRMGRDWQKAIAAFEHATHLDSSYAAAFAELSGVLKKSRQLNRALTEIRTAIQLQPTSAEFHGNLAAILTDMGLLDEAESEWKTAIHFNSGAAEFQVCLGNLLEKRGDVDKAFTEYSLAISKDPRCARAYSSRAVLYGKTNRLDAAFADHHIALNLEPNNPELYLNSFSTLVSAGSIEDAERCCRRALELDPSSEGAWECLGRVLRIMGRFDEARSAFRRSLDLSPSAIVSMLLTSIEVNTDSNEEKKLNLLVNAPESSEWDKISAGFALGKILDDSDRFDEAFAAYHSANVLHKQSCNRRGLTFSEVTLKEEVDRLIFNCTNQFFTGRKDWGCESELPVFVVGMPRSGTTLVEQIAATHSKVFGAGELPDIPAMVSDLSARQPRVSELHWDKELIEDLSNRYLQKITQLPKSASRIVDKMPANIFNLGLIATLFPKAKVIFCQRNPLDNCLSCYFQLFAKNSLLFSYDLVDCATQCREQKRLFEHWQKVLPLAMLSVQYEELVNDLEGQAHRLIDFLGLEWESACLDFHKTQRAVHTASVWQVRQPIYTRSVGRWKHYEKHLAPLLQALGDGDPSHGI